MLGEVVGLGFVADGIDVALGMGGIVGGVVDVEDVVVIEFVVDVNVAVVADVDVDGVEALVMGGVVPLVVVMLVGVLTELS